MGDFNLKTWLIGYGRELGITLAGTGILFTANHIEATELPPEYVFYGGVIATTLHSIYAIFKHIYLVKQ